MTMISGGSSPTGGLPGLLRRNRNWRNAFTLAAPKGVTPDDVVDIIAISDGENAIRPWVGVFLLRGEGHQFLFLHAECPRAGWDSPDNRMQGATMGWAELSDDVSDWYRFFSPEEADRLATMICSEVVDK
jgi:hypothetical protein